MSRALRALGVLGLFAVAGALAACGGGGGGSPLPGSPAVAPSTAPSSGPSATPLPSMTPTPTPGLTPTPSPPPDSSQTIETCAGCVSGETGMFTPSEGDTSSGGTTGAPVDGDIDCDPTMSNNYHIHIYLGIYYEGEQVALPIAVGMVDPGQASDGFIDTAQCFYYIHTHDQSGIVHIEYTDPSGTPITQPVFDLKNVLDVWGITTGPDSFGPFSGPVEVFTSGQVYRGDQNDGVVSETNLTYWGNNANSIPLYSHEIIDILIGPTYPQSLPNVAFYLEY